MRDVIIATVNQHIRAGLSLRDAVMRAQSDIIEKDLSREFTREYFSGIALQFWGSREVEGQVVAPDGVREPQTEPAIIRDERRPIGHQGSRVVAPKILNTKRSLFDCLINIGDRFKPLGDLTRADCETAADRYRRVAVQHELIADFLIDVRQMIPDSSTRLIEAIDEDSLEEVKSRYAGLSLAPSGL